MKQVDNEVAKSYIGLTKHTSGGIKELWSIALPLILSSLSFNLMLFVDRVVLAKYSLEVMNAASVAGMSCFLFIYFFIGLVNISQVIVGQLHGSGQHSKLAQPVWQMIWLSLFSFMVFIPIAFFTYKLFIPERFIPIAKDYYIILLTFAPITILNTSISTFFNGQGKSKIIFNTTLICNLANLFLNILLVFGYKGILPAMGIMGSAIATICSQLLQLLILLSIFFNAKNVKKYGSFDCKFRLSLFFKCLRIGLPSATGHILEIAAWAFLVNMVSRISDDHLTVMNIGQSLFIIISCISDGMQKSVSIVVSNFIGARKLNLISKCLLSAIKLQLLFGLVTLLLSLVFRKYIPYIFLPDTLAYQDLIPLIYIALIGVWVFFIFDGIVWIIAGILTAAEDTFSIMVINAVSAWLFAILPIYIFIYKGNTGAEYIWVFISIYAALNFLIFFFRYQSNKWVKKII